MCDSLLYDRTEANMAFHTIAIGNLYHTGKHPSQSFGLQTFARLYQKAFTVLT